MIRFVGLAIVGCLIVAACVGSSRTTERTVAIDAMLAGALAEPVGGVVAVVRFPDGETITAEHGFARDGEPIDRDDLFRIGSITKTYIATLVVALEEDGLVSLDTPVAEYLPTLGIDARITVRHLLTHSSGLADYWAAGHLAAERCGGCEFTPQDLVDLIDVGQPQFEPGSHWSYANTGFVILGMLVEVVTRNDLAVELRERVLEPAGVQDSYLSGKEPTRTEPVTGHWRVDEGVPVPYPWSCDELMTRTDAAGSLVASAPQVLTFLDALFAGRIVPEARLAEMLETVPRTPPDGDRDVRFGFGIHHPMEGDWWMHGGGLPGFVLVYFRDPATDASVVVLSNCFRCLAPDGAEFDVIAFGTRLMDLALIESSEGR